jgi:hypothetical protein
MEDIAVSFAQDALHGAMGCRVRFGFRLAKEYC